MDMTDWTTPGGLGDIAAEELRDVLELIGVNTLGAYLDDNGRVYVSFRDIKDAETMVSLGVPCRSMPGALYDRATGGCLSIDLMIAEGREPGRDELDALEGRSWSWDIHPYMIGFRMDWHVSVDMPAEDAATVAANLNSIARGRS